MSDPCGKQPTRQEAEAFWRGRLIDARIQLRFARDYVREVQRDLESGNIGQADGQYAFQHAMRAENLALEHYEKVLRIVEDLIVRGKMPEVPPKAVDGSGGAAE